MHLPQCVVLHMEVGEMPSSQIMVSLCNLIPKGVFLMSVDAQISPKKKNPKNKNAYAALTLHHLSFLISSFVSPLQGVANSTLHLSSGYT